MYLAKPSDNIIGGVLVLHSWWGLNAFFRDLCDRLASKGFVALAPDLYSGKVADTIPAAKRLRALSTANRKEPIYKFLIREIGFLASHTAVRGPHIATLGYSMGGHWAFWLAQRPQLPITATVTFYAARAGDFSATRSAFLCHLSPAVETWGRSISSSASRTGHFSHQNPLMDSILHAL